jgi:hypothetical protein
LLPSSISFDFWEAANNEVQDVAAIRTMPKAYWMGVELAFSIQPHDYMPEALGFGLFYIGSKC